MRTLHYVVPVLLCGACSASAPEPAVVVDSGALAASSTPIVSAAPPPMVDEPLPARVVVPKEPACLIALEKAWPPSLRLRLSPDGAWFADISDAPATFSIPSGKNITVASAEVTSEGFTVRGYFHLSDRPLHAKRAFAFGAFMVPSRNAEMRILDAADGKLTLAMDPPKGIQLVGAPPQAIRPCDDVVFGRSSFDAEDFVAKVAKKDSFNIDTDHPIDLSVDPNGPVVARLTAEQFPDKSGYANQLYVFEKKGLKSRVFYYTDNELVFGWIASKELRPDKNSWPNYSGDTGGNMFESHRKKGSTKVRCSKDVALIAEASPTERAVVADIPAGKEFSVLKKESPLTTVSVNMGKIALRSDIDFKVRAQDIADCEFIQSGPMQPK